MSKTCVHHRILNCIIFIGVATDNFIFSFFSEHQEAECDILPPIVRTCVINIIEKSNSYFHRNGAKRRPKYTLTTKLTTDFKVKRHCVVTRQLDTLCFTVSLLSLQWSRIVIQSARIQVQCLLACRFPSHAAAG